MGLFGFIGGVILLVVALPLLLAGNGLVRSADKAVPSISVAVAVGYHAAAALWLVLTLLR